jgi:hypothetical protein
MKIHFEIKSRGSILINYGGRIVLISGELTFEPSIFYADLNFALRHVPIWLEVIHLKA